MKHNKEYQDSICDNQKIQPDQSENDFIKIKLGATKPIIKYIKIITILFKVFVCIWFTILSLKLFGKNHNITEITLHINEIMTMISLLMISIISYYFLKLKSNINKSLFFYKRDKCV